MWWSCSHTAQPGPDWTLEVNSVFSALLLCPGLRKSGPGRECVGEANARPQLQTMTQKQTYFKSPSFIWPWKVEGVTAVPLKP